MMAWKYLPPAMDCRSVAGQAVSTWDCGGQVFPSHQQCPAIARAALAANVRSAPLLIIKPESILAAAHRTRLVPVSQRSTWEPQRLQNSRPLPDDHGLDVVFLPSTHVAHFAFPSIFFAYAICRDRTQFRISSVGRLPSAITLRGQTPNFSRYLWLTHPA